MPPFCFSSTRTLPLHIHLMLNWWIKLYQAQNQSCAYPLERTESLGGDRAQKMHSGTLISPGPSYVILNKEQRKPFGEALSAVKQRRHVHREMDGPPWADDRREMLPRVSVTVHRQTDASALSFPFVFLRRSQLTSASEDLPLCPA